MVSFISFENKKNLHKRHACARSCMHTRTQARSHTQTHTEHTPNTHNCSILLLQKKKNHKYLKLLEAQFLLFFMPSQKQKSPVNALKASVRYIRPFRNIEVQTMDTR